MREETAYQLKHSALLFLTAVIWGNAFVVQVLGMDYMGPLTFTWARSLAGGLFLLLLLPVIDRLGPPSSKKSSPWADKTLWIGGFLMGLCLYGSTVLQQIGLLTTSVGKAGFLTALYIVFVPIFAVLCGRRLPVHVAIAGVICLIGVYFLCMTEDNFVIETGDILVITCALGFTLHILVIDYFAPKADAVRMSAVQFFVGGTLGFIPAILFETVTIEALTSGLACILYAGCVSNGIAYTLQIIGQKGVHPAVASLIMSLESAVSALAGWFWLGQTLTTREIAGCLIMGFAIILAQIPASIFEKKKNLN